MWKTFLQNKIVEEQDIVTKLLELDDSINLNTLLELIYKDINILTNYDTYLIESNPIILINLIDRLICTNKTIIVCSMDNYSLNTYIINKYKEYLNDYDISSSLDIRIEKHFNIEDNNIISIGSNAFNKEMKSIYNRIDSINFEL
jgi:hypothetical protein